MVSAVCGCYCCNSVYSVHPHVTFHPLTLIVCGHLCCWLLSAASPIRGWGLEPILLRYKGPNV